MKLNTKLAVYISLLACVCAAIVSAISYTQVRQSLERSIQDSIVSLVKTVHNTAAAAVYVENVELADEVKEGLESNDIIRCVSISGFVELRTNQSLNACQGERFYEHLLFSPFDTDEKLGAIRVYRNDQVIEEKAKARAMREVKIIAAIIFITVVFVYVITYLSITKPIHSLASQLENIDFANNAILPLASEDRKDEIGVIGRVINLLVKNASSQIKREKLLVLQTTLLSTNFKMTFELSKTAIAVVDSTFFITSINPAFAQLFQSDVDLNSEEFRQQWMTLMLDSHAQVEEKLTLISDRNKPESMEVSFADSNYLQVPGHVFTVTAIKTEDAIGKLNYLLFLDDITTQKKRLAASEREARVDQLTGLQNRGAGQKAIAYALTSLEAEEKLALLVLDLDGFKEINDNHGHDSGDTILQIVAKRLTSATRASDIITRWGGDEFVLALINIDAAQALAVAQKVIELISRPIQYKNKTLRVGVSVGIAMSSDTVGNFAELFDAADKEMYRVKKSGKNAASISTSDEFAAQGLAKKGPY